MLSVEINSLDLFIPCRNGSAYVRQTIPKVACMALSSGELSSGEVGHVAITIGIINRYLLEVKLGKSRSAFQVRPRACKCTYVMCCFVLPPAKCDLETIAIILGFLDVGGE